MATCKVTYTDEVTGKIIEFTSDTELFNYLQDKNINKNINELVDSLDKLKDSKLVEAFENIQMFLGASYRLEWFNKLRQKFPELKEASSRLSSLNKNTTDLNLKQAQSIVAFLQSGLLAGEAVKKHVNDVLKVYSKDPLEVYNQLYDANNFAVAYLEAISELKDFFVREDIPSSNEVFITLQEFEKTLKYITVKYKDTSYEHVVDTLWNVFKNTEISGNHIDILKQLDDLDSEILEARKKGDSVKEENLKKIKSDLENSHPEIESRKARLKESLIKALDSGDNKYADRIKQELEKLNTKKITKEILHKTLLGNNGDVGWLSAYLEAAGMSGDPIISGLQKILDKHQRNIRKEGILIQDELDTLQKSLFRSNGGNKNDLKKTYKDLYQWVDILTFDEEGNEVTEKRFALNTEFDWGFLKEKARLVQTLKNAKKEAEVSGNKEKVEEAFKALKKWERENLELLGNENFYEVLDSLSLDAREALDEIRSEITFFEHLHKNQFNLTADEWKDYKRLQLKRANLYSKFDPYTGKEKEGKALKITEDLLKYREAVNNLYNNDIENPEGEALWEKHRKTFENILVQRLNDGIINQDEYKLQMSIWHQKNSLATYSQEFYDKRKAIYDALAALNTDVDERVTELRTELSRIKGTQQAKDDQNQPIGDLYTDSQVNKIKEIQEELEIIRQTSGKVPLKDRIAFNKLLKRFDLPLNYFDRVFLTEEMLKSQGMTDEEFNLYKKVNQNSESTNNEAFFNLIEELNKIQETVTTEYYEDIKEKKLEELRNATPRINTETEAEFDERTLRDFENSEWFLNNHYDKIIWDKVKRKYTTKSEPISIWTITRPKNPNDIFNKPNYNYSRTREIKEEYKNPNSKFDTILKSYLPKLSKWRNSNYPSNPEVKKVLEDLTSFYLRKQEKTPQANRLGYYLGGKEQEFNETILNSGTMKGKLQKTWSYVGNRFNFAVSDKDNGYGLADLQGNPFQYVPVRYTSSLDENDQSYDIFGTMMGYLYDVEQANELQKSLPTFKSISNILKENVPHSNKLNILAKTFGQSKFIKGSTNNRAEQVEALILTQFYKEYKKKGENRILSKAVDNLNGFAALTSLAYNIPSSVVNWMSARVQTTIESISSEFFNYKIWKVGEREYAKYAKDFMADFTKSGNKSFISNLINLFDPIVGEYNESVEEGFKRTALREIVSNSPANYLREIGEHEVQLSTLLGILKSKTVSYKGKNMSLLEAYEQNFTANKTLEFKSGEISFLVQGNGTFSKTLEYNEEQELNLIRKIQGINIYLHGNYSKLNQAMAERYSMGRIAFFFRKYFVPMFAKRFANFRANTMLDTYTEGYYQTFYKNVILELYNMITKKSKLRNPKNWWDTRTNLEQANLKRFASEILIVAALTGVLMLLTALGDDDDDGEIDDDANFFLLHMVYLAKRVKSETEQFIPGPGLNEFSKTVTTPSVAYNMQYRNTKDMVKHSIQAITGDELGYLSKDKGMFTEGDPKILGDLLKLIGLTGKSWHPEELIKGFDFAQKNL